MESENPMDRLICGDVGFGKTEIAIRAAFKAIDNGKQVAFSYQQPYWHFNIIKHLKNGLKIFQFHLTI